MAERQYFLFPGWQCDGGFYRITAVQLVRLAEEFAVSELLFGNPAPEIPIRQRCIPITVENTSEEPGIESGND